MTHDATAASPIVCETSKHSMRCTVEGSPSASCSAASRSSCVAFCASFWRIANVAFSQRHREPHAPLAAGIADDVHLPAGLRGQHFRERGMVLDVGHDDRRRHRPLEVVLREERRHDLAFALDGRGIRVARKERPVADVPAAADHHHVHGEQAALDGRRRPRRCRRRSRSRRTGAIAASACARSCRGCAPRARTRACPPPRPSAPAGGSAPRSPCRAGTATRLRRPRGIRPR